MSNNNGSQWVWVKYILLISLALVFVALGRLTWWSFLETRDWFLFLDSPDTQYVALATAVVFQFGQGPVLFLRGLLLIRKLDVENRIRRAKGDDLQIAILESELSSVFWGFWGLSLAFLLFATIDAWTNTQQMWGTLHDKELTGMIIGTDKYILTACVGIVAVFFEEILGVVFSLGSHTFNDIRVVHGLKRIGWLDAFADHARNILSGPPIKHGGGGGHQQGGGNNFRNAQGGMPHNQNTGRAGFQPATRQGTPPTFRSSDSFHTPEVQGERTYHPNNLDGGNKPPFS